MWRLILLHAVIASTYTIGKAALEYAEPIFFIAARMLVSGILLLIYCFLFSKKDMRINVKHSWLIAQFIFFLFYLPYILDFSVLKHIDSSKWALLYTLLPFFVGILSYYILNESITIKKVFAFVIGIMGVLPVLMSKSDHSVTTFFSFNFYDLIVLISVISTAYGWIIARKLIYYTKYSVVFINGLAMLATGILAFITSPFLDNWSPSPIISLPGFINTFSLIVIANIFVFIVNMVLLRIYTATFINLLIIIDPLYAALYGWIFLGETVTWQFFVSFAVILIGLYLFYTEELRERNEKNHHTLALSK